MANVAVTNSFSPSTTIVSSQVNTNFSDLVTWLNNRNAGTAWDAFSSAAAITITPTSNQIVLGTTRTVTITAPTPASSSRVWTIPDITAAGTFAAVEGAQTFTGAKIIQKTSTNTAFSSEVGTLQIQNASSTANNLVGIMFLEANGNLCAYAGAVITAHAASSISVSAEYIIATKAAGSTGNPVERVRFPALGGMVLGAVLATTATDGFIYIPTCAGTPTGTPTAYGGTVPFVYDSTNHKLYIYDGSWRGGTVPGAWS